MTKNKEEMNEEKEELKDDIDEEEVKENPEEAAESEESAEGDFENEKLKAELEEQTNRAMRLQADFDNYRKRVEKEKADIVKYAAAGIVEKLLPVLDNFDRAIAEQDKIEDKEEGFFEGVKLIHKQLLDALEAEGLKEIESKGVQFDPNYHNAVQQIESDEHDSNVVVDVYQKGYLLKERVIRPSMVAVAK